MRYLRMLSNAVLGGALAAAYLTLLMLHLNPAVPLTTGAVMPVAATLGLSYGVHIAAVLYAAYVLRQITTLDPVSPGWFSVHLLTWSAAGIAAGAATIAWLNARGFDVALEPRALEALMRTALALATAATALLLLAATGAAARGRWDRAIGLPFVVTIAASIAAPVVFRGPALQRGLRGRHLDMGRVAETQVAAPHVVLVLLDGASLDVISPAVAEGRLPNFGRLLDGGASMHLATTRPTQPEPVWASVLTGKWPPKHGIQSSRMYRTRVGGAPLELLPDYCFAHALVRFGFLTEEAHLASEIRTRPLWHVLTGYGVSAGLVGLPLTHPPEPVHGFVVSDRFHRLTEPAVELDERPTVYPPEFTDVARESLRVPTDEAGDPVPTAADDLVARASALMPHDDDSGVSALFADRVHHDLAKRLSAERDVRLLAVRYQGLDAVGHYYLRFAMPRAFGDVQEDERRQFGRVLEEYYAYVDTLVGSAMATLQGDDLLLVVSGFGMEPLSPGKRLLERVAGNERFSGTHERAPDGFLLAFGSAVARGRVPRGALVDVTPTILYFLGLAVARDMDGFARTDLFSRAFTAQRTITFIPTYDR